MSDMSTDAPDADDDRSVGSDHKHEQSAQEPVPDSRDVDTQCAPQLLVTTTWVPERVLYRAGPCTVVLGRQHAGGPLIVRKSIVCKQTSAKLVVDEPRVAKALIHPAIVRTLGYYTEVCDGPRARVHIFMEYVTGTSLRAALHERYDKCAFRQHEIVSLVHDLTSGIHYMHTVHGMVHGDLKCENVLLRNDGHAVLVDFGLSMKFAASTGVCPRTATWATAIFRAPETVRDHWLYSTAADVWGLGLILKALLFTRMWVVSQTTVMSAVQPLDNHFQFTAPYSERFQRVPAPVAAFPNGIDPRLAKLCDQMLQWHPQARPSVGDVLAQLQAMRDDPLLATLPELPVMRART